MKVHLLPPPAVESVENGAWDSVRQGWQQVFGSYDKAGFSIENHQFWTGQPIDWARSFHPGSLEICFNFAGYGRIETSQRTAEFFPRSAGFYLAGGQILEACRAGGEKHHFLTLELSPEFIRRRFASEKPSLRPIFQHLVEGEPLEEEFSAQVVPLSSRVESIARSLLQPGVSEAARSFWFESKVVELVCEIAFAATDEKFCARYHRVSRERVEQVIEMLREQLCEPPNLAEISRRAGCSPFHLSRIFSAETGKTIPQYLRQLRMEKAGELLLSGKFNVTEAAFAVGYSSLSHFSKSFSDVFGYLPRQGGRQALSAVG